MIELETMQKHFQTLRERTSQNRRQGMDTKIVEIKMLNVMPKIMMAKSTGQDKDAEVVEQLLSDIEREMKQLRIEQRFEDVLKKVEEEKERFESERLEREGRADYVRMSQQEVIEKTNKLINQARENLEQKAYEKVLPIYLEIRGIYQYLPRELKERVYADSIDIYHKLRQTDVFKTKGRMALWLARLKRRLGR